MEHVHTWIPSCLPILRLEGFLGRSRNSLLLPYSTGVWQVEASTGSGISLGACPPRTPTPLLYPHSAGSLATAPAHSRQQRAGGKSPQKRQAEPLSECAGWTRRGLLDGTSDAVAPQGLLKVLRYQDICRSPCFLSHLLGLPVLGMCPRKLEARSMLTSPGLPSPLLSCPLLSSLLSSLPLYFPSLVSLVFFSDLQCPFCLCHPLPSVLPMSPPPS